MIDAIRERLKKIAPNQITISIGIGDFGGAHCTHGGKIIVDYPEDLREAINFIANAPTDIETLLRFHDEAMEIFKFYSNFKGSPGDPARDFFRHWEAKE